MAYLDIDNLYKDQRVLLFKKLWATEKIHGTSAWITFKEGELWYHSGGGSAVLFRALFDHDVLLNKMKELFGSKVVKLHGEFYGGKLLKMSHMYGKESDFIMFDIRVDGLWLSFDKVLKLGVKLKIPIVEGEIIESNIGAINRVRDKSSALALKKGLGVHVREGIVLKPLEEFVCNNGERVIAKHKNDEYMEINTPRKVVDPAKLKLLEDAKEITEEWVTPMRLIHILDKFPEDVDKRSTGDIIKAMIKDVEKEAVGEVIITREVRKTIGDKARKEFFSWLNEKLKREVADNE